MSLVDLIGDRPIAYHRCFRVVSGSTVAGLFLAQAVFWQLRNGDEWWRQTRAKWERETGMSRREIETARARLCQVGLLSHERRGLPAESWYFVNLPKLEAMLQKLFMAKPRKKETSGGGKEEIDRYLALAAPRGATKDPVGLRRHLLKIGGLTDGHRSQMEQWEAEEATQQATSGRINGFRRQMETADQRPFWEQHPSI